MSNFCQCGCGTVVKRRFVKGHYCIGKHQTEEAKEKNRKTHLGRPSWNKGKVGIYSEETLQKIRESRKNQIMISGRHHSEESKEKNRLAHLGKIQTEESNNKRSEKLLGKPKTDEHKKRIAKAKLGKNNPQWQGGISKLPYSQDWTEDLKDAIRKRDNYICQLCGIIQGDLNGCFHKKLTVHHIDYDKENCDPDNLVSLCQSCHAKTGYERDRWKVYFRIQKQAEWIVISLSR